MGPAAGERSVGAEAWALCKMAVPLSLGNLPTLIGVAVLMMMGPLGVNSLAGAGLGWMWCNVTAKSVILGTQFGLGALCSQAFGAKNYKRVGLLLQRQLLFHWLLCCPIGVMWWYTESLLLRLGQLPSVAAAAGQFVVIQLPALPLMPVVMDVTTFCAAQRIVRMPMLVSLFANGLAVGLTWVLMYPAGLGFVGAPIALLIGQLLHGALLILLTRRTLEHPTLLPPSHDALHSWRELIGLGFGAAVGLWAEWWSGEVMIVMAGMLCSDSAVAVAPDSSQGGLARTDGGAVLEEVECTVGAATTLLWNTGATCWLIHGGFAIATPTRMGNALGAGDAEHARFVAAIGATLQSGVGALVSLLLFAERYRYGALFSMEGDGLLLVGTLMPFANVVQIGIAVGCGAMRSILTGLALVTWPALIQIFAFWPVALLLGYTLAFNFGFGVVGLWIGEAIGCEMQRLACAACVPASICPCSVR